MSQSVISNGIVIFGQISDSERNIALQKFVVAIGECCSGSKLEAEREFYMELDVPELAFKRPFLL